MRKSIVTILAAPCLLLLACGSIYVAAHDEHMQFRDGHEVEGHAHRRLLVGNNGSKRCGTREMEEKDRVALARARSFSKFVNARRGSSSGGSSSKETRTFTVCFHSPTYWFPLLNWLYHTSITNEQLQTQLDHLNNAFTSSSCCDTSLPWCHGECSIDIDIRFEMARLDSNGNVVGTASSTSDSDACVTRRRGFWWTSMGLLSFAPRRIKSALHVGDSTTLNVYFVRSAFLGQTLLGFATFPFEYAQNPKLDGVVIEPRSIDGSGFKFGEYDEGDTLVHEVGHWLGLYHTFEGGCSDGDFVDDTPAQGEATFGCAPEEQKDTCPGQEGIDPLFNFMDYSSDRCLYEFTSGQATLMLANVDAYRNPGSPLASKDSITRLADGARVNPVDPLEEGAVKVFAVDVVGESSVECQLLGDSAKLYLFMNWTGEFEEFDCQDESDASDKVCSVGPNSGTAYAIVYATAKAVDFQVTCTVV